MALIHRAQLRPSKLELLAGWLPGQEWFRGEGDLQTVASYRFDDPDGEVGIETLLVRAGDGPVLQVPLTYRGAPLGDADDALVGTLEHSVLGTRWVYDAPADPVYLSVVKDVIAGGGQQAAEYVDTDGELVARPVSAEVRGTGQPVTRTPQLRRVVEPATVALAPATPALLGRWADLDHDVLLVTA